MGRLRADDGFTMIGAVVCMAFVLILSGIAVTTGVHGLKRSVDERSQERAQAAADAGLDVVAYRMNKALLTPGGADLLGVDTSALKTAGCLGANAVVQDSQAISSPYTPYRPGTSDFDVATGVGAQVTVPPAGDEVCDLSGSEALEGGATFRYATSVGFAVNVGAGSPPVVRKVVAIGEAGGVKRRVIGTFWIDLSDGLGFERRRYVRCPGSYGGADPFANCPNDPPY